MYSDEEEEDGCEEEEEEYCEETGRVVATVPAKEPKMDAVPLKSALKKAGRGAATPPSNSGSRHNNSNQQTEKSQGSRSVVVTSNHLNVTTTYLLIN